MLVLFFKTIYFFSISEIGYVHLLQLLSGQQLIFTENSDAYCLFITISSLYEVKAKKEGALKFSAMFLKYIQLCRTLQHCPTTLLTNCCASP